MKIFSLISIVVFSIILNASDKPTVDIAPLYSSDQSRFPVYKSSNSNLEFYKMMSGVTDVYVKTGSELIRIIDSNEKYFGKYVKLVRKYLQGVGLKNIAITKSEHSELSSLSSRSNSVDFEIKLSQNENYITSFNIVFSSCNGDEFIFKSDTDYYLDENWDSEFFGFMKKVFWHRVDYNSSNKIEIVKRPTSWNEKKLWEYFDKNEIDAVEGIYEKYDYGPEKSLKYKIGIVKESDDYSVIYLSGASNTFDWQAGELKAVVKKTAIDNFYSVNYVMSNKQFNNNVYLTLENNNLLSFEFINELTTDTKRYVKIFPDKKNYENSAEIYNQSGTGFAVSEKLFLTNYHVIENSEKINLRFKSGEDVIITEAEIISTDKKNDLALLKLIDEKMFLKNFPPYKLSTIKDALAEEVFTMGFPLIETMGYSIKVNEGIISSENGFLSDEKMYQISIPIHPGNSGGPLFNKNGELVGVVGGRHADAENSAYALKANYILDFIEPFISANKNDVVKNTNQSISELVKVYKNFVCLILAE